MGIEQVACDDDEGGTLLTSHLPKPADGAVALTSQLRALVRIRHAGIGLAQLPVGGVEEAHGGIGHSVITVTQPQLTNNSLVRRTEYVS
jgi:hypothetical protein